MRNWTISFLMLLSLNSLGQVFPEGIPFQAQVFGQAGNMLSNQTVAIRFNIRSTSSTGLILWQEDHTILLNSMGYFSAVIGSGTSTGVGTLSSFDQINWMSGNLFLETLQDENNTGSFISISNERLMAVPFAFHSKTTSQVFALSQLADVDTSTIQIGDVLKWNGTKWVPEADNLTTATDTVSYAYNAGFSGYSDTAAYAINCVQLSSADSAQFSFFADSAAYAQNAQHAEYSDTSLYANTADTALFATGNWSLTGNAGINPATQFLGTTDSIDLVFRSFDIERMRIKANGRIGIGTPTPLTTFHVANTNGVVFTGTHGVGAIPVQGGGTRMMWYPGKSAFRAGYVSTTNWDDVYVGQYSFSAGYNTRASGLYSVAFGINSIAGGEGSFVAGKGTMATGLYSFAAGENAEAQGDYGVALGRGGKAQGYCSAAIGYHAEVYSSYGMSLGNYTTVTGTNSVAMGYHAQALHNGSFIFTDQSDPVGYTQTTADNQFMIKASGGYVLYTNATLTTGVVLPAGAGSWSTLSDCNVKDNITPVDITSFLDKLDSIEVFEWNYISQDSSVRHIGPMAQDFYNTFGMGTDSTVINSGDFDGINFVLLQALNQKTIELEAQGEAINEMTAEIEALRRQREELEKLLVELEKKVDLYLSQQQKSGSEQ